MSIKDKFIKEFTTNDWKFFYVECIILLPIVTIIWFGLDHFTGFIVGFSGLVIFHIARTYGRKHCWFPELDRKS